MNYFIFVLILTIIISQDILLFNEETLILFCFIGFCWLFIENIGVSINIYLKNQSIKIQKDIDTSYNNVLNVLKQKIEYNIKIQSLSNYFLRTKKYYYNLNYNILLKLINLQVIKKQIIFQKKIIVAYELEQQLIKLIILLIINKIKTLVLLNIFYKNKLDISNFICINKIILREYFETIK